MSGTERDPVESRAIEVNGEAREVAAATVAALVAELGLDPRSVAVERNGAVVSRPLWPETEVAAGDRIELVRFVQGG